MENINDIAIQISSLKYIIPLALSMIFLLLKILINKEFELRFLLLLLNGYPANITLLGMSFLFSCYIYIAELLTVKTGMSILTAVKFIYEGIPIVITGAVIIIALLALEKYNEKRFREKEKKRLFIFIIIGGWILSILYVYYVIKYLEMTVRCFN